jgi:elongation factor P--(R)-beta-lysine ligase
MIHSIPPVSIARYRADTLQKIRDFFRANAVLEVETPVLSHGSITDCHIDLFTTLFYPCGTPIDQGCSTMYLQTSPEFHMKRLLAAGYPDIFQISKVFRNGERGKVHNPEFTMIEWYRTGFTIDKLMDEVAQVCSLVLGAVPEKKTSYRELFQELAGIDPLSMSLEDLVGFCSSRESYPPEFQSKTDILNYIMTEYVEPKMPEGTLLFVYGFPAEQAVLATISSKDPRTANRFEAYFNKVELCNGYNELGDPEENERRLHEENRRREQIGKPSVPVDRNFLEALRKGIPECSGVALGFDRLLMLGAASSSIDSVLNFPWESC